MSRVNLYRSIHKAIRAMLAHLIDRSSRTAFSDHEEVAALRRDLLDILDLLSSHADVEDRFVHPLLASVAPAVLERLERSHDEQEYLHRQLPDLLEAPGGHAFVLILTRYTAEQLVHMADEEDLAMPALQAAYDDARLGQVQAAILGSIPPPKMGRYLRWMLPALDPEERAHLLLGMRASAPPAAFAATMALCREVLDPQQYWQLPEEVRAG